VSFFDAERLVSKEGDEYKDRLADRMCAPPRTAHLAEIDFCPAEWKTSFTASLTADETESIPDYTITPHLTFTASPPYFCY